MSAKILDREGYVQRYVIFRRNAQSLRKPIYPLRSTRSTCTAITKLVSSLLVTGTVQLIVIKLEFLVHDLLDGVLDHRCQFITQRRTNRWIQRVPSIEIDQRSRDARVRFERIDQLFELSSTSTHSRLRRRSRSHHWLWHGAA